LGAVEMRVQKTGIEGNPNLKGHAPLKLRFILISWIRPLGGKSVSPAAPREVVAN
jgi:hypothetical protein